MAKVGKESGLEVRFADSWTAYDHLSPATAQKITKAMQNMRIDQKVNELLKVALLMEHGGVLVSPSELLLTARLSWLFTRFEGPPTEVFLFSEDEPEGN